MPTANDREVAMETGIRWLACDIFKDNLLGSLIHTIAFSVVTSCLFAVRPIQKLYCVLRLL